MENLLEIKNLKTYFYTDEGTVPAVDDVTLTIPKGKTLGVVGESGCGKSVTALSVMRLIDHPGKIVDGEIRFAGRELTQLTEKEIRKVRGGEIAMIFQEPMTSLNPVFSIGNQIVEAIELHQKGVSKKEAWDLAIQMLEKVRIPMPEQRVRQYPHEFSGGMRQRAMIAMALSCEPELLIADEPSTALDVTIQAQILELLRDLQRDTGMSIMIITHDLGVVAEVSDLVAVMYASKVVERATTKDIFANPLHPYTQGLLASKPKVGQKKSERLQTIDGMVPSPLHFPSGCKFHPRCPKAQERCREEEPEIRVISDGHECRCHFA